MSKSSLANKAIIMFCIMLFSKVLGFGRDILMAYKFGTTYINDAYTVAITVPSVLFAIFVSGFAQSYIPFCTRIKSKENKDHFFSNTFITLVMFSIIATMVCVLFSPALTKLLAPGFNEKTAALTSKFVSIIVLMFPFYTGFTIMSAHLQTEEKFAVSNFCDFIIVNLIVIFSIAIANEKKSFILAIGYCLSMVIAFAILAIYFKHVSQIKFSVCLEQAKADFIKLFKVATPVGLSFMINQVNSITDQMFSSTLGNGVISGLNYANKIQSLFLTMTTTVFMTICFPRINKSFASGDKNDGMYYVKNGFLVGSILAIPFAIFIITFARPIIMIIFQHGAFNEDSTTVTSGCLLFYSLGIPFYTYTEIESRTLAADMKQKIILKNTFIAVLFNIITDYIFMHLLGYIGLSLATSLSGALLFILMGYDLKKRQLWGINKEILIDIIKITSAAIMSAFVSSKLFNMLNTVPGSSYYGIILGCFVFGVLFFVQCYLYKITVLKWMLDRLWKRNNWKGDE